MNDNEVDAALCLWEAMLDQKHLARHDHETPLLRAWSRDGTVEMRARARDLGTWVERIYQQLNPLLRDYYSFDWEIVPNILATIEWPMGNSGGYVLLKDEEVVCQVEAEMNGWK